MCFFFILKKKNGVKRHLRTLNTTIYIFLETNVKILDVYPTSIKTKSERVNAMEVDFVCDKIYESYSIKLNEKLILDGRPK